MLEMLVNDLCIFFTSVVAEKEKKNISTK